MSRTTTTARTMPHIGKVRLVVVTSVAVVLIDPSVVVVGVVAVPVVVGCVPCVVGDGCCWSTLPAVAAPAGGVVWAFVF
jgi:outer membrane lipoprotein SlyB